MSINHLIIIINHSPDAILSFISSVTQDSVSSINISLLLVLSMSESTVLSCFLFQNTEETLLPSLLHSDCLPHISLVTCKARSCGAVLSKQNRNEMVAGWGKKRAGEKGSCGGKSGDREDHQGLGVGCHVLSWGGRGDQRGHTTEGGKALHLPFQYKYC